MRLEFLQGFWGIVDESETSCLSTTELCLKTEDINLVLVGLVELGELASEIVLGDVGSVWVEDITIIVLISFNRLCANSSQSFSNTVSQPPAVHSKS